MSFKKASFSKASFLSIVILLFIILSGLLLIFLSVSSFTFEAFFRGAEAAEQSDKITDMAERELEVPGDPERVVALGPGMLRKIVYMNAEDKIAGVEDEETAPDDFIAPYQLASPELRERPVVGPTHGGDAELIASVEPDLVLYSGDPGEAKDLEGKLEVPVVTFEFGDIYNYRDRLYESLELLGKIINRKERSQELINFIENTIADLRSRAEEVEGERPAVYAGGMSYRGGHGLTSVRYPFPPFEFLKARDVTDPYLNYEAMNQVDLDRELLISWDPEIIFLDLVNLDLIRDDLNLHPEFGALTAFSEGNVYGLFPYASYHVNFSTVLVNSYYIGSIIYPEQFADIDPEEKADHIYKNILGSRVYEEMVEEYGGLRALEELK